MLHYLLHVALYEIALHDHNNMNAFGKNSAPAVESKLLDGSLKQRVRKKEPNA